MTKPILGLIAATIPLLAHHSTAGMYDINKTVQIQGTVTEVHWMNPHATFSLDVKRADGTVINWAVELPSPNSLTGQGFGRNAIVRGDQITADVWVARNGSLQANARSVLLPDGRTMSGASRWDPPIAGK